MCKRHSPVSAAVIEQDRRVWRQSRLEMDLDFDIVTRPAVRADKFRCDEKNAGKTDLRADIEVGCANERLHHRGTCVTGKQSSLVFQRY